MKVNEMKKKILSLLPSSTISDHDKNMLNILLNSMDENKLRKIHDTLQRENHKIARLEDKKKRIELKYRLSVENLSGKSHIAPKNKLQDRK